MVHALPVPVCPLGGIIIFLYVIPVISSEIRDIAVQFVAERIGQLPIGKWFSVRNVESTFMGHVIMRQTLQCILTRRRTTPSTNMSAPCAKQFQVPEGRLLKGKIVSITS